MIYERLVNYSLSFTPNETLKVFVTYKLRNVKKEFKIYVRQSSLSSGLLIKAREWKFI